jgi:hypothetical protein
MTIQPWEKDPAAVAYEFMTAGGMNTPEQIDDLLKGDDRPIFDQARSWADEAAENWTLHVSIDDLADAMVEFIQNRPDRADA